MKNDKTATKRHILLLVPDLLFQSRIREQAHALGYETLLCRHAQRPPAQLRALGVSEFKFRLTASRLLARGRCGVGLLGPL